MAVILFIIKISFIHLNHISLFLKCCSADWRWVRSLLFQAKAGISTPCSPARWQKHCGGFMQSQFSEPSSHRIIWNARLAEFQTSIKKCHHQVCIGTVWLKIILGLGLGRADHRLFALIWRSSKSIRGGEATELGICSWTWLSMSWKGELVNNEMNRELWWTRSIKFCQVARPF